METETKPQSQTLILAEPKWVKLSQGKANLGHVTGYSTIKDNHVVYQVDTKLTNAQVIAELRASLKSDLVYLEWNLKKRV